MPTDIADLETPALLVDLDIMERNLTRAAEYAAAHGLALRPHVKTHKSPRVAARQLELGAVGLTCATPFEAGVMSTVASDILVAYPPVGAARAARLAALPSHVNLLVALDSTAAIEAMSRAAAAEQRTVGVYVELDVGWMAHPFPSGSFKVSTTQQIEAIQGLGAKRIRCIRSKVLVDRL